MYFHTQSIAPTHVSALISHNLFSIYIIYNTVLDIKHCDADIRPYFTGYSQLYLDIPYAKDKNVMNFKLTYINVILKTF
jgi:hypothetical protein